MASRLHRVSLLLLLIANWPAFAAPVGFHPYYGQKFIETVDDLHDEQLKWELNQILKRYHLSSPGQLDQIVDQCPTQLTTDCYKHKQYNYTETRRFLFGHLHLEKLDKKYTIRTLYCLIPYGPDDFPRGRRPGPGQIPDPYVLNTEHVWPQSRFTDHYSKSLQKTDLHILFPADSRTNTSRSNLEFAEVQQPAYASCDPAKKGFADVKMNRVFFEPPKQNKGNVARALFYFAIRYETSISPLEESYLRKWHHQDPVDEAELRRHEEIFEFLKVRNPFIDHPELVSKISDF